MIRVCLVEDQTIVRQGLRTLLDLVDDIEVVAEAVDGEDAVRRIPDATPDVVLLDMRMPRLDGLGVLTQLGAQRRLPPTIILTTFDDESTVLDGIRAGAKGFLLKDVTLDQLTGAIRTVAEGGTMIQPAVTDRILKGLHGVPREFPSLDPPDPLTTRETDILRLIAGGYSNREIAGALDLAEGTVKNHISSILSKLGVRDRTRCVLEGGRARADPVALDRPQYEAAARADYQKNATATNAAAHHRQASPHSAAQNNLIMASSRRSPADSRHRHSGRGRHQALARLYRCRLRRTCAESHAAPTPAEGHGGGP